ncbi:hypothetical protein Patl1_16547 [Pistacia atlantica]|uniref:Uncharacterized protein n=1 Tax=Pistacia atlantica TaxID=434234 RepID=A0ACC1B6E8_9ROSI|nr:hypothetical protein Patl1_16547 [Pistacia atlantica]
MGRQYFSYHLRICLNHSSLPSWLAARKLLDSPPQNNTVCGYEHDNQSKSGVRASVSNYAGSASGDTPSGPPSPISFERLDGRSNSNLKCVYKGVDAYGKIYYIIAPCSNNGNEGGQENYEKYYAPPPLEHEGNHYYDPLIV